MNSTQNYSAAAWTALVPPLLVLVGLPICAWFSTGASRMAGAGGFHLRESKPAFSLETAEAQTVLIQGKLVGWRHRICGNVMPKGGTLNQWEQGFGVNRYRLTPGGPKALFIWEHQFASVDGNIGYEVFARVPGGYRDVGALRYESLICTRPNRHGQPRIVTTWHWSAGECTAVLLVLTRHGFRAVASRNLYAGDSGTSHDNHLFDSIFFNGASAPRPDVARVFHLKVTCSYDEKHTGI
ncbi:MAG: hypothetical protein HKL95_10125 [Phycisphaerae bacterium]|nr:hypothetical protein [Phycisphaerae bacterium]